MSVHTVEDPIAKLVSRGAVSVHPEDTLEDVARALDREGVGAVLVTGAEGVVGIVSERDIVRAMADPDLDADRAEDIMTFEPETVDESETVLEVSRKMMSGQIRHLPVVDEAGIYGVVSIRDLLAVFLGHG